MEPLEAYARLRIAIPENPSLRFREEEAWGNPEVLTWANGHPYKGFCYIASKVFCDLVPGSTLHAFEREHFWSQIGNEIWDATFDQFIELYDYSKGRKTRTKGMCKRSLLLKNKVLAVDSGLVEEYMARNPEHHLLALAE